MRIAFVSDNAFPWFNGGIEKRRYVIMRGLVESGNEVHCFTMYRKGMPGYHFVYNGIRYHCAGDAEKWQGMYTNSGKRRSILMPLRFSLHIFTKIFPYHFDIVDADSFPFLHIFPLYFYSRIRKVKFAVTWHEIWSRRFWTRYLGLLGYFGFLAEWLCARMPDVHVANASTTKELMEKELGVKPHKVVVFPAAVDREEIEKFAARHKFRKKNSFIVVSRLVKHKRVQLAIESVAKTNAKLVVVGTGPEQEYLEGVAREWAPGQVTFKTGLSTEKLFEEICRSKALILPSEREGLSLATLEALALGTPVVIAHTSSLPNEVRVMCLEAKENQMGELLKKILKSNKAYEEKAMAARKRVLEEFSGDRADAIYEGIIRR